MSLYKIFSCGSADCSCKDVPVEARTEDIVAALVEKGAEIQKVSIKTLSFETAEGEEKEIDVVTPLWTHGGPGKYLVFKLDDESGDDESGS